MQTLASIAFVLVLFRGPIFFIGGVFPAILVYFGGDPDADAC